MHQQPDTTDSEDSSNTCFESNSIQQVRKRTFSHWLHGTSPSSRQLIKAGFSYCNDGDRVICIYCYLICHQWTPHVYDPFEVHKTFSPNCPYVKSLLVRHRPQHIISNNDSITIPTAVHPDPQVVPQVATVDDYIQPTYFNTNLENNVTCPSCNRAFRNLDPDENPMIDHARQFPHCVYVKQLRGIEIYRQIHESNRAQQGMIKHDTSNGKILSLFSFLRAC
jgi:hypothetical protein